MSGHENKGRGRTGRGIMEAEDSFFSKLGVGSMLEAATIRIPQIGFATLNADFPS